MDTSAAGGSNAGGIIIGLLIWAACFAAYFAPSIIALIRRVPNTGSVIVVDLLLGWTIIGWIVALAMALRSRPQPPAYYAPPPGYYPPQAPQQQGPRP